MKAIKQSLLIMFSMAIILTATNTVVSDYLAPIVILFAITVGSFFFWKKGETISDIMSSFFVFLITTGALLIIFMTGGLDSNFFFLSYLLIFAITFMFEPITIFVFLIALVIVFLNQAVKNDILSNIVRLAPLIVLSLLAFFFGNEYKKNEKEDQAEATKSNK